MPGFVAPWSKDGDGNYLFEADTAYKVDGFTEIVPARPKDGKPSAGVNFNGATITDRSATVIATGNLFLPNEVAEQTEWSKPFWMKSEWVDGEKYPIWTAAPDKNSVPMKVEPVPEEKPAWSGKGGGGGGRKALPKGLRDKYAAVELSQEGLHDAFAFAATEALAVIEETGIKDDEAKARIFNGCLVFTGTHIQVGGFSNGSGTDAPEDDTPQGVSEGDPFSGGPAPNDVTDDDIPF